MLRLWRQMPDEAPPKPESPEQRIVQALAKAEALLSQSQIRERAETRHKTVGAVLGERAWLGRVECDSSGIYRMARA